VDENVVDERREKINERARKCWEVNIKMDLT
jgi:hypothetical protein